MKIKDFKSGQWLQAYQYKSFSPTHINHTWTIDDEQLNFMLSRANILLGELNAFSTLIPNVDYFIKMHIKKEATNSSRIEGTQTNIEDILQKIENIIPEKQNDWQEVENYIKAMNMAIDELNYLPLCNRLLKQTHRVLLQNVRGEHKSPGEFRHSQNWIGGASINDAVFVPPQPNEVIELMSDLELFLQNKSYFVPDIIKIGIAHYQFETIHPFCDGNGRIGRLLITLYLVHERILCKPTLYLSDFFVRNKILYYDNLMQARQKNNLNQWLRFFLEGVIQTADNSIETFKKIISMKADIEQNKITKLGKKVNTAQNFLLYLFGHPIVDSEDVSNAMNINVSTGLRLINDFVELGILHEMTGFKRNRIFKFEEYIRLFADNK
ncbi:MAG: Fic family protein [Bacteroidales bacterium]|jgi:Fic family protein|nr:Fic family protein [Bacteroidales bacterium]